MSFFSQEKSHVGPIFAVLKDRNYALLVSPDESHISTSPDCKDHLLTAEQLQNARASAWRQTGNALLTADDAAAWLREAGLVLFLPRTQQVPAPAGSFVEATSGAANATPAAPAVHAAQALLRRLLASGDAVALNLLGLAGDQPDYLATEETLPFLLALRGDREWKRGPRGKSSPLVVEVWKLLQKEGPMTADAIKTTLGKHLTEAAALRALTELWNTFRVEPVYDETGEITKWQCMEVRHTASMNAGANQSQGVALSALVSVYLQAAIAATGDEIEAFLSPIASRSRVREAVRGLLATRQLGIRNLGPNEHYFVEGSLPEFSDYDTDAEEDDLEEAFAASSEHDEALDAGDDFGDEEDEDEDMHEEEDDLETPKDRSRETRSSDPLPEVPGFLIESMDDEPEIGEGRKRFVAQRNDAAANRDRRAFSGRSAPAPRSGDRPARPFNATEPWKEDRKPRPFGSSDRGGDRGASRPPFGEKRPFNREGGEERRPFNAGAGRPRPEGGFSGSRPYSSGSSDRRPFSREGSEGRPSRSKPEFRSDGRSSFGSSEGRSFRGKPGFGGEGRSSYGARSERPSFGSKPGFGRNERPSGEGRPFRDKPAFGDKPSFRGNSGEGRPSFGDRPSREGGAPRFEKKPFTPRSGESRSFGGTRPPRRESGDGERRPFTPREGGSTRPFRPAGEDRPFKPRFEKNDGERRPFTPREGSSGAGSEGGYKRPFRPAGDRPSSSRPSFDRGERRPFTTRENRGGERRPFTPREDHGGERRPFTPREDRDGERKSFAPREGGFKPHAGFSRGGDSTPRERKPFGDRPSGDRPFRPRTDGDGPRRTGAPGAGAPKRFSSEGRPPRAGAGDGAKRPRTSKFTSSGQPRTGAVATGRPGARAGRPAGAPGRPAGARPSGPRPGGAGRKPGFGSKPGFGPRKGPSAGPKRGPRRDS